MKKLLGTAAAWWLRKPENRARLKRKGKQMLDGFRGRSSRSTTEQQHRRHH
ncbi:hypothetical protein HNO52_09675 [Billgrantia diversa]|uniref:hypothetical protein n=1 Tax=Halomonas sp. MCCC 1A13316 TaxID=2733487 RepID=UPI0018A37AF1|nr:hypothetical protein [Halomonas sp. MCCC 1A13316]QOR38748.1 hypothetical protein HNO52_09675 [Halomonas sp. MCCC 1A13316]